MVIDGSRRSWVPVTSNSDFPIQNLPFGVFQLIDDASNQQHIGVAIGEQVLNLRVLSQNGFFKGVASLQDGGVFEQATLNTFMAAGQQAWRDARRIIAHLLDFDTATLRDQTALHSQCLHPHSSIRMCLPATIGDYTDFYSSRQHAYNVGVMFRGPANALQPNWLHLPVGYHGRSSSIVVSGCPVRRPCGQLQLSDDASKPPGYGPCVTLDYELEMGFFVGGKGNQLGEPITMDKVSEHIFGVVLVNDWSARDVQKWEYVPLGPFTAKNFATTISPWVVSMDAIAPFRVARDAPQDPPVLPYLRERVDVDASQSTPLYNIELTVGITPAGSDKQTIITHSNAKYLYWTFQQQLVHHTVSGCNMRPGDMLASGTISGPGEHEFGSMLELCWKGSKEIQLSESGQTRKFLRDGDNVAIRGWAQGDGFRVGFGEAAGIVTPAVPFKG